MMKAKVTVLPHDPGDSNDTPRMSQPENPTEQKHQYHSFCSVGL